MGQLLSWLSNVGAILGSFSHDLVLFEQISAQLSNPSVVVALLVFSFAFLAYSILRRALDYGLPLDMRSDLRRYGDNVLIGFACTILLSSTLALSLRPLAPPSAPQGPVIVAAPDRPKSPAGPLRPEMSDCAGQNCGTGGPDVDPIYERHLMNQSDIQEYEEAKKSLPKQTSYFCQVTARTKAKNVFEYEIKMPPSGYCRRFIKAEETSRDMQPLIKNSTGQVALRGRSIAYAAPPNFRGRDFFSARSCVFDREMAAPNCVRLEYHVIVF